MLQLDEKNFDEVVKQGVVLVDFFATWCGPCQMLMPVLNKFAEEQEGRLTVGKVNIDDNKELVLRNKVMSVPTLLLFKDGELLARHTGAMKKEELDEWLRGQGV